MTPLDHKIARLIELKDLPDRYSMEVLNEILEGQPPSKITQEEIREYWLLEKEVEDAVIAATVVISTPQSHQFIRDFQRRHLSDEDAFQFGGELQDKLFWSHTSPEEYSRRLFTVEKLRVVYDVPANLKVLVDEVRRCAAHELYNAVASLSRTIFESAVTDIALRTNKIPPLESGFQYYKNYPHHLRLGLLVPESSPDHKAMDAFYSEACSFVHGAKSASWSDASSMLEKSLRFVEMLYARHRHSLPKEQ